MSGKVDSHKESAVIAKAEAALETGAPTADDLDGLLKAYRKLTKQMERLTRIGDKQQLQLKELNELKNRFVGMAAHDLRNPIALVQGFSDLMLKTPTLTPEQVHEFLGMINDTSNNMAKLLNDLLDVSAIESGRLNMEVVPGRLDQLIEKRVALLDGIAKAKDIQLATALEPVDDVLFDGDRLGQVVDNLISNAIKFSKVGTTTTVSCRRDGDKAVFAVSDHGQGIPADEIDRVFGAFQRLSVRPTGDEKSHGLGMAIVKKIVTAHQGRIEVASTVGEGSTFTVFLPLSLSLADV